MASGYITALLPGLLEPHWADIASAVSNCCQSESLQSLSTIAQGHFRRSILVSAGGWPRAGLYEQFRTAARAGSRATLGDFSPNTTAASEPARRDPARERSSSFCRGMGDLGKFASWNPCFSALQELAGW